MSLLLPTLAVKTPFAPARATLSRIRPLMIGSHQRRFRSTTVPTTPSDPSENKEVETTGPKNDSKVKAQPTVHQQPKQIQKHQILCKRRVKYCSFPSVPSTDHLEKSELFPHIIISGYRPLSPEKMIENDSDTVEYLPLTDENFHDMVRKMEENQDADRKEPSIWTESALMTESYEEWWRIPREIWKDLKPFSPPPLPGVIQTQMDTGAISKKLGDGKGSDTVTELDEDGDSIVAKGARGNDGVRVRGRKRPLSQLLKLKKERER